MKNEGINLIRQVNEANKEYFAHKDSIWDCFDWCCFSKCDGPLEISISALEEMRKDAKEKGYMFVCPWLINQSNT